MWLTWNFKVKSDVSEPEMRFVKEHSGSSRNGDRSPSAERVLFVNGRMKPDSFSKHWNLITPIFWTQNKCFWSQMRSLGNKWQSTPSYMQKKYFPHISYIDLNERSALYFPTQYFFIVFNSRYFFSSSFLLFFSRRDPHKLQLFYNISPFFRFMNEDRIMWMLCFCCLFAHISSDDRNYKIIFSSHRMIHICVQFLFFILMWTKHLNENKITHNRTKWIKISSKLKQKIVQKKLFAFFE